MKSEFTETWQTNNRITLALLDAIPSGALGDRYSERTRTVAAQFTHIHYVRVRNLKQRGPDFLADLSEFPKGAQPKKGELKSALKGSGDVAANASRPDPIAAGRSAGARSSS